MKTPAELIAGAVNAKPPHGKLIQLEEPTTCALSGVEITEGYPVTQAIPKSYGRVMDTFKDPTGFVAIEAATAIANDWNLGVRLIFEDGTHYHPLINREAAEKQGRECLSDLVRAVWPAKEGQAMVFLLVTDVKKRAWPRARAGRLGTSSPITLLASEYNIEECRYIPWVNLLAMLDRIESTIALGFSGRSIHQNLLDSKKGVKTVGVAEAVRLEREWQALREYPEFIPALIISQPPRG